MSAAAPAVTVVVDALARALDDETAALAAGEPLPPPGTKLVLLAALENGTLAGADRAEPVDRAALELLSAAARRNRAALAARRDAARSMLDDLYARLAEAADDGTYTRADALGLARREPGAPAVTPEGVAQ